MMHILEKLIAAVEALTRNAASVGSPAHDLIAEAKAHFEAEKEPKAEDKSAELAPVDPMVPAPPYEPPVALPEEPALLPVDQQPEEHS